MKLLDNGVLRKLARYIYAFKLGTEDDQLCARFECGAAGDYIHKPEYKVLHENPDFCRALHELMQWDLAVLVAGSQITQHTQPTQEQLFKYQQASEGYKNAFDEFHVLRRLIAPDNEALDVPPSGYLNRLEQNAMG